MVAYRVHWMYVTSSREQLDSSCRRQPPRLTIIKLSFHWITFSWHWLIASVLVALFFQRRGWLCKTEGIEEVSLRYCRIVTASPNWDYRMAAFSGKGDSWCHRKAEGDLLKNCVRSILAWRRRNPRLLNLKTKMVSRRERPRGAVSVPLVYSSIRVSFSQPWRLLRFRHMSLLKGNAYLLDAAADPTCPLCLEESQNVRTGWCSSRPQVFSSNTLLACTETEMCPIPKNVQQCCWHAISVAK